MIVGAPVPSALDTEAMGLAVSAGAVQPPVIAEQLPELNTRDAARLAIARLIDAVQANLVGGTNDGNPLTFATVRTEWPTSWEPSSMPMAIIVEVFTKEDAVLIGAPVTRENPATGEEEDIFATDANGVEWALWSRGEDEGEIMITVKTSYQAHTVALATAVRDALSGDLDRFTGACPPMPTAALPLAFQAALTAAELPSIELKLLRSVSPDSEEDATGNTWRTDIMLSWHAGTFRARRRLPDLAHMYSVEVVALCRSHTTVLPPR